MPKGYTSPPHTHPTAEYVTVLSGTLYLGEGDRAVKKGAKALKAGGWASIPEGHHHYAISDAAETEVQVHAIGPFEITYVNPADDPRNEKQAAAK
jgi:quercetin dioxygenase-like cupin family protein